MLAQMTVEELHQAMGAQGVEKGGKQRTQRASERLSENAAHQTNAEGAIPLTIIDVREPWEFSKAHIDGAESIPLAQLSQEMRKRFPDKETPVLLYCDLGIRSNHAAKLLRALGYRRVLDLQGGIYAYENHRKQADQMVIDKKMIS